MKKCYLFMHKIIILSFLRILLFPIMERLVMRIFNKQLQTMHCRLFNIFLPVEELALTIEQKQMALQAQNCIWQIILDHSQAKTGLIFLATVRSLYIGKPEETIHAYYRLMHSHVIQVSKLAKDFRLLYVGYIYNSDFGKNISGYKTSPVYHPNLQPHIKKFKEGVVTQFERNSLTYNDKKKELTHQGEIFDYIIVGSGAAGAVLAHQLRKNHQKVLVVEKGSFVVPGAVDPRHIHSFKQTLTSCNGSAVIRTGNLVGGGPMINLDLAFSPTLPAIQNRIKNWRENKRIAADQFNIQEIKKAYKWVTDVFNTQEVPDKEITPNNELLRTGSKKMGWNSKIYSVNCSFAEPHCAVKKINTMDKLLLQALCDTENPLHILPDTQVQQILFHSCQGKKVAYGVRVKQHSHSGQGTIDNLHNVNIPDTVYDIRAKNVILAAGAVGSPEILIRSGVNKWNANVGKGAVLHPAMPVFGLFDHEIHMEKGITESVYNDTFATDPGFLIEAVSGKPEYGAVMYHGSGREIYEIVSDYSRVGGFGVILLDESTAENKVVVDKKGRPRIVYQLTDFDKNRLKMGIEKAVHIIFAANAKRVGFASSQVLFPGKCYFTNLQDALCATRKLTFAPQYTMLMSAHIESTNKMGTSPQNSVVDPDHRVWGTQNLYVVDGSIFPTTVGANPMQSIYTIAKIFADKTNNQFQQCKVSP